MVEYLSIACTVATALVLYLYINMMWKNKKVAFYTACVYSLLVGPLTLGISGFTHDHIQLLLIVLIYYCAGKLALGNNNLWAVPLGWLIVISMEISNVAFIGIGGAAIIILTKKVGYAGEIFILAILGVLLVSGLYMGPTLSKMPQGRMGSKDIVPVSLENFLIRYNILLLLLPTTMLVAWMKEDSLALVLLVSGFILMMYMDRGTRIVDLGIAMCTGHILARWDRKLIAVGVLLLIGVGVNAYYIEHNQWYVSEADYKAAKWLSGREGRVLCAWDRGYMIQAIAGVDTVSDAGHVDYDVHQLLSSQSSLSKLREHNVSYVVLDDRDYEIVTKDDKLMVVKTSGLIFYPIRDKNALIVKLRYDKIAPVFRVGEVRVFQI
jgi:hypothetical protein